MATAAGPQTELKRGVLGTGAITYYVVSAAAPLMIMAGVAPLAILAGGIGAAAAYPMAGVVLAIFAVGFTTMSRYVSGAGAFYTYVTRGLGRPAGVAAAVLALMSYNSLQIGMYGLLGASAKSTVESLTGVILPWPVYAMIGIAVVWYAGFRSVEFGARLLAILLAAETLILVVLAVAVVLDGGPHGLGLDPFEPSHVLSSQTSASLTFAFAAFIGFESTVLYRMEARDPRRTIPRATFAAVAFLGIFYGFIVWMIVQAYGATGVIDAVLGNPEGLFFSAAEIYVGDWASDVMHVLVVTSLIASLVAFHNAINRYALAISQDGLLPKWLGVTHARTRSPYRAGILQTGLSVIVVGAFAFTDADPTRQLLIWVNTPGLYGLILLQVLVALAVPMFFRRITHRENPLVTLWTPILAAVLMTAALYLAIDKTALLTGASTRVNVLIVGVVPVVVAIGLGLAAWLRRKRPEDYERFGQDDPDPVDTLSEPAP
ncbi:amino acid/polyamine/organocation transporter (APC superfamily) [Actinomadura pelletieri DSM 43383]|uniref:Amino acid/polyamine/organocation transporter (APC superfamily) n=1 Tax=Actinomadura pelletieri DSM 43383 TaxID=1120940 RepID=A0A495QXI5_9ACTN|nr:APC family permease [Actinomadura pelletieri]RKS78777.1 amino acid/polyamine/organocation transporter (APC superfamily) [Actinomadura pelletieri DSM 43383]